MKLLKWISFIAVFIVGIILGLFIRSWNGINWSQIDYGSVPDWFGSIGTVLAIFSTIVFFIFNNKEKLIIKVYSNNHDTILDFRVMNVGRRTGTYRYWGTKISTGKKENLSNFKEGGSSEKNEFISLSPGAMSGPKELKIYNVWTLLGGNPANIDPTFKFDVGILNGVGHVQEITINVEKGKIVDVSNERTK